MTQQVHRRTRKRSAPWTGRDVLQAPPSPHESAWRSGGLPEPPRAASGRRTGQRRPPGGDAVRLNRTKGCETTLPGK